MKNEEFVVASRFPLPITPVTVLQASTAWNFLSHRTRGLHVYYLFDEADMLHADFSRCMIGFPLIQANTLFGA